MKVGFVGVGSMGRPMLEQVLAAGHEVAFFARRAEVVAEVAALGATARSSAAEVGDGADVVVVCVFTDDQVHEVCRGADGLVATMPPGAVLVVHTTCRPETIVELVTDGEPRRVRVLDAAFSGGPMDAARGELTVLVGGDDATLERVRPVLTTYAGTIVEVGGPGDGQRVKLVNNALFGANVRLVVEAERLARDLGIDPAAALAAMTHCSANSYALGLAHAMGSAAALVESAGRYITKDVATARDTAARSGADVGLLGSVATEPPPPSPPDAAGP